MNAAALFRLFRPIHWRAAALALPLAFLLEIPAIRHPDESPGLVFFALLTPTAFLGLGLAVTAAGALARPSMALLPGMEKSLLRWNVGLAVGLATVWAIFAGAPMPSAPLWAKIAICVAAATAPLPLGARLKPSVSRGLIVFVYACYLVGAGTSKDDYTQLWIDKVRNHPVLLGIVAAALASWNITRALDRTRLRRAELTQPRIAEPEEKPAWTRLLSAEGAVGYQRRDGSLKSYRSAIADERPRPGYRWGMIAIGATLLLFLPAYGGGYPIGWYTFLFDRNAGVAKPASILALVGIFAMGCFAPRLRSHHLYPASRRRRAMAEFANTVETWGLHISIWIAAPIAVGAIVGWALGLPVSLLEAVQQFALPSLMAAPALVVARCGTIYFEGRHAISLTLVEIGSLVCMILGWIIVVTIPPQAGLIVMATTIALSLALLWAATAGFYRNSDLIWPVSKRKPLGLNL